MTTDVLSQALDAMVERPGGMYGSFEDIPLISQKGHARRLELLDSLDVGDVRRMTVVDFGMGSWGFGSVYGKIQHCSRAIGMDISRSALEISKKLAKDSNAPYHKNFEVFQSDGMGLPLESASVDLFFSGESIEHVSFPPRFLSEIYRVLKDDGQLIVTTPNRDAIKYREAGEEYCTSPEHFWLFNWPELERTLSEFFVIKKAYGFNGSFGSHEEDGREKDDARCEAWSREFLNEPENATGLIVHLTKRANVGYRYEVKPIPSDAIQFEGVDTRLSLEFGLKGELLDKDISRVTIKRPPSDGVVCRFWCHRWSGIGVIKSKRTLDRLDLYAYVPGWRQWINGEPTTEETTISVAPAFQRNDHAEANQVIFHEAFTWSRVPLNGSVSLPVVRNLAQPGYGFSRYQTFVGTSVFLWFTEKEGNLSGAWQPIGGRKSWTGDVAFWERQIREIMMANIDAVYVHCINAFREQRDTFFRAYANLRAEGWDVPKIAPFLDPFYLWRHEPIDVATTRGKQQFVEPYIDFFEHYFSINTDHTTAAQFLLTVDGRLVLTTWWVTGLLKNVGSLKREEVVRGLYMLEEQIPQLKTGIYVMSAALVDPDITFSDERMVMFSGYTYALHSVHDSVDVWHVQPGYWDQNIRSPGYLLPRSGGSNYRSAWDIVVANMPGVHRVYVESWNEYDEGSGIYAAEPKDLLTNTAMHSNTDTFSATQDPYEYIRTTALGAAKVNGRPAYGAKILAVDLPTSMRAGSTVRVALRIMNQGNVAWTRGSDIGLSIAIDDQIVGAPLLDQGCNTGAADDVGLVRGQVFATDVLFALPQKAGRFLLTLSVTHAGQPIGTAFSEHIEVVRGWTSTYARS